MLRLAPFVLALLCVIASSCTREDPNVRMPDWEENFDRANQATRSGEHDRAIEIGEAYLKKHPDNVDGHLMVAAALQEGGRAVNDARRPARFEQAVKHYSRVLEISNNKIFRVLALSSLVQLYHAQALNNPDEALRYARMFITENPKDIEAYGTPLYLLTQAKKYDEAVALLAQAKGAMEPDGDAWARYGGMVHDLVAFSPDFSRETARTLLADTVPLIEKALSKYGRTEKLLLTKGMLLRAQAELEPDAARQRALQDESSRTFDEMDRLAK